MPVKDGDETPDENDDYTGFKILATDSSRICRVVRGRRYRPARTLRKCTKPEHFGGVRYTREIVDRGETPPSTSDVTISTAMAVDVTASGVSIATSSKRLYGYLERAVGGRGRPFFCRHGFSPRGMGLGSIRGGATSTEEDADADAELETRSTCSFNPRARVEVSKLVIKYNRLILACAQVLPST